MVFVNCLVSSLKNIALGLEWSGVEWSGEVWSIKLSLTNFSFMARSGRRCLASLSC
ncbi:hypothetical protein Scep_006232 [Stephania cephalantha]|uniref:Uncharacterized protein n=1 Tax=Stephania cephalantha TaxID=152367 RepID=A0AAP0PMU0_9MAGN